MVLTLLLISPRTLLLMGEGMDTFHSTSLLINKCTHTRAHTHFISFKDMINLGAVGSYTEQFTCGRLEGRYTR